ncbi:MAG: hypothetical protein WC869_16970, partial [Phycisphaerae bacterium]
SLSKAWRERIGLKLANADAQAALNRVLRGGSIEILPAEAIRPMERAEHRARTGLYGASFKTLWGYMIPASAYREWRDEHDEIRQEFEAGVDLLVVNLDEWLGVQRAELASVFSGAWENIRRLGGTDLTCREFVDAALADLYRQLPDPTTIREHFTWDTTLSYAPMVDEAAEAEARARLIREEALSSTEALREQRERVLADIDHDADKRREAAELALQEAESGYWQEMIEAADGVASHFKSGAMCGKTPAAVASLASRLRAMNVHGREDVNQTADNLEAAMAARMKITGDTKSIQAQKGLALGALQVVVAETRQIAASISEQIAEMRGARVIGKRIQVVGQTRQIIREQAPAGEAPLAVPRQVARVAARA